MPKKTWLEKLKVGEISLVDAGANRGAVSILMKRVGETTEEFKVWIKKQAAALGLTDEEVVAKISGEANVLTLEEVVKELQKTQETVAALKTAGELSTAIGKISIDLAKVTKLDELPTLEAEIAKLDQKDARIVVLTEHVATRKAAIEKGFPPKKKDPSAEEEAAEGEVAKRLDVEIKKNATLASTVEKMVKENTIAKIKATDLKDLEGVVKMEEMAETIYKLRQHDSAAADVMVAQLKALGIQSKKSPLFKALGSDTGSDAKAEDKLDSLAKAMASEKGISFAKAYGIVLDAHPELYAQAQDEKPTAK